MKALVNMLAISFLAAGSAWGQQVSAGADSEVKPTHESIRHLLEVMEAKSLVESMNKQLDAYFKAVLAKSLEGKTVTAEQQQKIDKVREKFVDLIHETMSWESMEPTYFELYEKTFSQSEIDSMITFYGSPAGHAIVRKLPLVTQNAMALMQQRVQTLMPRIQAMVRDAASGANAGKEVSPKSDAG